MNKVENQVIPLGQIYLNILDVRNETEPSVVPSDRIEALSGALDSSLRLIHNLALLAAITESNLVAVFKVLDRWGDDPVVGKRITEDFQDLVALKCKITNGTFGEVSDFAIRFEKMVRDDTLRRAGIDPKDEEASMAYLVKLGAKVVLADPPSGN